ncbi:hypothetical protein M8C21_001230 [Ambrosia artemisiifolia]|uniref:Cathepsin propeptide inhibitor domain-containing protein n=1 Tax=Ambrosia artemisiifolia TaxID=4212 RepID=A0AAD5G2B8_AMBAR|nr:hypothetical protein M8C21_001230 [Ambrosia artemisiifolia]
MALMLLLWKKSGVMPRRLLYSPPISHYYYSKGFSSSSSSNSEEADMKAAFEAWAAEHGKSYKTLEEKEKRFRIFRKKLRSIQKHNSAFPLCCQRQLTKFSDRTWADLHRTFVD